MFATAIHETFNFASFFLKTMRRKTYLHLAYSSANKIFNFICVCILQAGSIATGISERDQIASLVRGLCSNSLRFQLLFSVTYYILRFILLIFLFLFQILVDDKRLAVQLQCISSDAGPQQRDTNSRSDSRLAG